MKRTKTHKKAKIYEYIYIAERSFGVQSKVWALIFPHLCGAATSTAHAQLLPEPNPSGVEENRTLQL